LTITVKELLEQYFQKEDLQLALAEIGEPVSGTNNELLNRILKSWFKKHRTLKQLLEMLPEEVLQDICSNFGLSDDGGFDTLVRRILKNNVIQSPSGTGQPSSKVNDAPIRMQSAPSNEVKPSGAYEISKTTKRKLVWAGIVGASIIAGLLVSIVFLYDRFFPPPAAAMLTLSLISRDANQIPEISPDRIQFASDTDFQPITTELTIVIDNIGNAPASNVCITFYHEPSSNNWFDHHNTDIGESVIQDRGSNRGCQPVLKVGDDIRITYFVTVTPQLAEQVRSENPRIGFNVTYDNSREVKMPLQVCFDDCYS